jgi:hypothetical protein
MKLRAPAPISSEQWATLELNLQGLKFIIEMSIRGVIALAATSF